MHVSICLQKLETGTLILSQDTRSADKNMRPEPPRNQGANLTTEIGSSEAIANAANAVTCCNPYTPWLLVRKRTIPTERQPLLGEF
jgi:hypothetical protein